MSAFMSQVFECAICMDDILERNNLTITKCNHTFHSSCIFKNLCHRIECPMCRCELIEAEEEESSDDEASDDEASDTNSGSETDSEIFSENSQNPNANLTCQQISDKLASSGYNSADLIYLLLSSNWLLGKTKPQEKYSDSEVYEDNFYEHLKDILDGTIGVDYRDGRSYAEVLASAVNNKQ